MWRAEPSVKGHHLGYVAAVGCAMSGWILLSAASCLYDRELQTLAPSPMEPEAVNLELAEDGLFAANKGIAAVGGSAKEKLALDESPQRFMQLLTNAPVSPDAPPPPPAKTPPSDPAEGPSPARTWFPEAFLWAPEIVTTAEGSAEIEVKVPDQLTTWRILALAHDGRGQQAGRVTTFDSTLPLYVDPVVPGWLYAGDRILLPVSAVNTTDSSVLASVTVEASGAMSGTGSAEVTLSAGSSDIRVMPFEVTSAGTATVRARLQAGETVDAAERLIPVSPTGQPVEHTRSGTLASQRTFRLPPPAGASPETERIEVLVFPGPLAVLQLELDRLVAGARPEDPGYATALTKEIESLAEKTHIEIDAGALRKLRIGSWQRIVASSRAPDMNTAVDLLSSLHRIPIPDGGRDSESALELARRNWIRIVIDQQRADGTWSRRDRSTLQAVLVDTAVAARVLSPEHKGPRLKATAAIERYQHEITDPYTASVVLASGLAQGDIAESLRAIVMSAVETSAQTGEPSLSVPVGVLNPWGNAPSRAEVLAWVVLALGAGPSPPDGPQAGDFVTQLMSNWSPASGFGAGRADVVALEAVMTALGEIPGAVEVTLALDGQIIDKATLDPSQPHVPARLLANPSGRDAEITVASSFGVPGLAWLATRRSYIPWGDRSSRPGIEVLVDSDTLSVGAEGQVTFTVVGPSGSTVTLSQSLPSGALLGEQASARAALLGATLRERTDRVEITTRPFEPGEIFTLSLPVTPAFAGRFQTAPLLVSVDGDAPVPLRPMIWQVSGLGGG